MRTMNQQPANITSNAEKNMVKDGIAKMLMGYHLNQTEVACILQWLYEQQTGEKIEW